jgi:putative acetyltransferase
MIRAATTADAVDMARIMSRSVRARGPERYTAEQVNAWWAASTEAEVLHAMEGGQAWIAEADGEAAAFLVLRGDHIELLYTDPDHARRGLATALIRRAQDARRRLTTEASLISQGVFARAGFRNEGPVSRDMVDVPFTNAYMVWP